MLLSMRTTTIGIAIGKMVVDRSTTTITFTIRTVMFPLLRQLDRRAATILQTDQAESAGSVVLAELEA